MVFLRCAIVVYGLEAHLFHRKEELMVFSDRPEPPEFSGNGPTLGLIVRMIDGLGRKIDALEKDVGEIKIKLEVIYIKVAGILFIFGTVISTIVTILTQRMIA